MGLLSEDFRLPLATNALDGSRHLDRAVVVAVVAVRVVQVAIDEVIDVVAVRDRGVAAIRPVDVPSFVACAGVARGAVGGVSGGHREGVFLDGAVFLVVHVPVVQVIDVPLVDDADVPAGRAVFVRVVFVSLRHVRATGNNETHPSRLGPYNGRTSPREDPP